ncbi:hypothetical protein V5O48_004222 [Marasmius crinis-equi]|uniref:Protein kinase domain-containing protein n=1 Tax=Marasmius crinis-equi TaxID=585013 RepID=A0ABR3FQN5_9AGAR
MNETWNAESSGKSVVVKVLKIAKRNGGDLDDDNFVARALEWSHLKHDNILDVLGIDVVRSSLGVVSPQLKNGNILSYLEKNPFHDRLKSITEISAGLSFLHSLNPPLVHGNIKGRNIIVTDDRRCCISEFGPIRNTGSVADSTSTVSALIQGSVRWLAPEVVHPTKPPDANNTPRDLFSYALTIVEMMTGQDPFSELPTDPAVAVAIARGKRPARPLHPKEGWCPDNVWDLVEICWAQDPSQRPSAGEVNAYLEGLLAISTKPDPGSVSVPFFSRRVVAVPSSPLVDWKTAPARRRAASKSTVIKDKYLPNEIYSHLYKLAKRELASDTLAHPTSSDAASLLSPSEDCLRPGATHGIIQCHRYREKLYEVLHSTSMTNAAEIYQAVLRDEERVAELVEIVLRSKHEMMEALTLSETDLDCFMNALQDILDNPESALICRLRERIRCLLVTLCKRSTSLPQSMFITGVSPIHQGSVCGGAFGDVFRSSLDGNYVALKRLRLFRGSDQGKMCKKFCKEALLWKRLDHRFVLPLLGIDADTFPRQPCMVSPWMFNGTINEFLKRRPNADIKMLVRTVYFLSPTPYISPAHINAVRQLFEVIQGIEYLHSKGVVHGDIKGANILIDDGFHPRLADFGLTVFHDGQHSTTDHGGTLRWMAPELFSGDNTGRTFASDVFTLGGLRSLKWHMIFMF